MKKDKAKKLITSTLSAAMMLSIASGSMTAFASENEVKEQVIDNASEKQAKTAGTAFQNSTEGRKVSNPTTSGGLTIECYEDVSIPANYKSHVSIWEGVTIRDAEGNDINEYVDVKGSEQHGIEQLGYAMQEVKGRIDFKKPGVYPVTYILTDKTGDEPVTTEVTRTVTITENKLPEFVGGEDITIKVGEKFDPRDGISAFDEELGDVTSKIKWCGSVDTNTPGKYTLRYALYDGNNCNDESRIVYKTRVITVVADEEVAPEVEAPEVTTPEVEAPEVTTPEVEAPVEVKELSVKKFDPSQVNEDLAVKRDEIKGISNNGKHHANNVLENAIDGNFNTTWETKTKNSADFTNEVVIELNESTTIDKLVYGMRKSGTGFAKDLEIQVSNSSEGDDFEVIGNAKYTDGTNHTIQIDFEPIEAKRVKLVYRDIHKNWASSTEFKLYKAEGSAETTDETESNTPAATENTAPVLTGVEDLEMIAGRSLYFNSYAGVGATDKEDGRIDFLVRAKGGVDVNVPGEYKITYTVTDSQGLTTERVRTITVVKPEEVSAENNQAPVFHGINDMTVRVGDYVGPYMDQLYGVKAIDKEDGNISRKIKMLGVVKVAVPGVYKVRYSVRDSHGIMQYATRTITVLPREGAVTPEVPADQNAAPVFHGVNDISVTVGERISPLVGITASDREDGALTRIGVCGPLTPSQMLNTSQPGRFKVKYSVRDKDGLLSHAERYIYVLEKDEAPTFNGVEDTTIKLGTSFNALQGVTANDKEDGILTHNVKSEGTVDTAKEGVYPVTYKIMDSRGNQTTIVRNVTVSKDAVAPETPVVPEAPAPTKNNAPVLKGVEHKTIKVGDLFSVLQGVSASDKEDGDISNKIRLEGMVNIDKPGVYPLTYKVTDSEGLETVVVRNITVEKPEIAPVENTAPVLNGINNITIKVGEAFDKLSGISASDKEDGNISDRIKVAGNIDTNKAGEYKLTYTVVDSLGLKTKVDRIVTVIEEAPQVIGNAPVLTVNDMSFQIGKRMDLLKGVSAIDAEDGDIKSKMQISFSIFDPSTPGDYKVTYSITDSDGNLVEKTITITMFE